MMIFPFILVALPVIVFWRSPPVWSWRFFVRVVLGVVAGWVVLSLGTWAYWLVSPKSDISKDNLFIAQGVTVMGWFPVTCYAIPLVGIRMLIDLWERLAARRNRNDVGEQSP